jgi:hypothetical protein
VIEPLPLVTEIPEPAVRVALVRVLPVVLPINNWPSVKVVCPVPPLVTGNVPVKFEIEVDEMTVKSEPFQAIRALSPLAIVTPVVGPAPTTLTPKPPVV